VVREKNVECVVVDYAQLLGAPGKGRYEQMTSMSVTLRQLASSQKIVLLALCQMSRAIETRSEFEPELSDLKETGQLEQDADVIAFLCWPCRMHQNEPENKYQFFVKKNRNRATNQGGYVTCRFDPSRQKIMDSLPEFSHVPEDRRSDAAR
jgi:replicative DNA helicase